MSFAARILAHRTFRRRHLAGIVIALTLLLWGGVWSLAALSFNRSIDAWVKEARAAGATVQFTERETDGSPWTVHIHLSNFAYAHKDSHALSADEAVLYLSVLDWNLISAKMKGAIKGTIKGLPFKADTFKFGLMRTSAPPLDEREAGLFLWVHSIGIVPKTKDELALGSRIDELALDLRVMGAAPDFSNADAVKAWNEASGVIEFDHLGLRWGPMALSAKGTLALTADLQPEGAFSGRVDGLDPTLERFIAKGDLSKKHEALLRSALTVLSRPAGVMGAGAAPIVPVSLQNGGLFIGPVRVAELPALVWR